MRNPDHHLLYAQDQHLCHLTRTPEVDLVRLVRTSQRRHKWIPFDPWTPFEIADFSYEFVILKCVDVEESLCFGLEHFIKKVRPEDDD